MTRIQRLALIALLILVVPLAMRLSHRVDPFDPCSVLRSDEIAAAIGAPTVVANRLDEKQCRYRDPGGVRPGRWNLLTVEAAPHGAGVAFTGFTLARRLLAGASGYTGMSAGPPVGDASTFWAVGQMFSARRGDAYVTIDMRAARGDHAVIGPTLAAKALERM